MNYDFEIKLTTNKLQDIIINDFNKKKKIELGILTIIIN